MNYISTEVVMNQIYYIRKQKIMLDRDLSILYGVDTKVLNQAVKRNLIRFPEDFMFELTKAHIANIYRLPLQNNKLKNHDKNIELVFQYLDELIEKVDEPKPIQKIGFKFGEQEFI